MAHSSNRYVDSTTVASKNATSNLTDDSHPVRISAQGEFLLDPEQDLPIHPAAAAFPVQEAGLEEMIASFQADGQWEPVIVFEDQILDGQRRALASKRLNMPLRCRRISDLGGLDPYEWAVRRNLAAGTARHLTDSQRALIGARLCREVYDNEAKQRTTAGKLVPQDQRGRACDKAASVVNVRTNRVRQGLKVYDAAWPDLTDAVWSGAVVISVAANIADLPSERDRKRALAAAKDKNKRALREILGARHILTDGLGQEVTNRSKAAFLAAQKWHQQVKQLTSVIEWLKTDAQGPEARVLRRTSRIEALEELVQAIEAAKPWAQCPYCDHFAGSTCSVCEGTGFLTQAEYHTTLQRYAAQIAQTADAKKS